jgi:hypothetical protein
MTAQLNDQTQMPFSLAMAGDVEVRRYLYRLFGGPILERFEAVGTGDQLLASGLCDPDWIPCAPKRTRDIYVENPERVFVRRLKGGLLSLDHTLPSGPKKEIYDRLFDTPMPSRGPLRLVWSAPAELADCVFVEDAAYFERMLACFERSAAQCRENLALARQRECRRGPLSLVRNAPTSNVYGGHHDA